VWHLVVIILDWRSKIMWVKKLKVEIFFVNYATVCASLDLKLECLFN